VLKRASFYNLIAYLLRRLTYHGDLMREPWDDPPSRVGGGCGREMIELGAMRKPSDTVRQRPADAYLDLRRRAGELMARSKCGGDPLADWVALGEIDGELWPAMRLALDQCRRTGKLHPMIAAHLVDLIDGGLSGKVPPSWPEPTGRQTVWRHDAHPEDIACLYRKDTSKNLLRALRRAVPKTHAMIWRSKRAPVRNRAASKVMIRDIPVPPSWST
jgi:hypothetical protein